jgi:hypothetical protein
MLLVNNQLGVNIKSKLFLMKKKRDNLAERIKNRLKNQKGQVQQPILFSLN